MRWHIKSENLVDGNHGCSDGGVSYDVIHEVFGVIECGGVDGDGRAAAELFLNVVISDWYIINKFGKFSRRRCFDCYIWLCHT